ncbi:MAG: ABC transporter ATP-binding protein [Armatimonadota bacterium]|nr:ABC transporter ATP-binding protein [Armatimonadota bacterium]MDR7449187.1 ABC transporter ATP-binding protein [Armatimonadota bacterium]MDR7459057.1 ABC transporter ATP-binding protein [Armatimonadota bacterium]MDR7479373.1 ABC transporter ATP-binding protein [Armatimonadota bacterium]MDR7487415.1 ABC transporter ATP-binding protein [Armatimonadota bacterium]
MALDRVSLEVQEGELFGLLGPNGAGKTTLIKVLVTLLLPTAGRALVDGFDVVRQAPQVRERISVVSGGEHSGYGLLTVREQLWMFAQFYGIPTRQALARIDELLAVVGLTEERDRKVQQLSTGMRQKMNLVRGLLPDPRILFLDEPTLGLDVEVARVIRAYVQQWPRERAGRTILLTTHYMAEAEELCDRIAIIHQGRIIACDTPAGLKRAAAQGAYFLLDTERLDGAGFLEALPGVERVHAATLDGHTEIRLHLRDDGAIAEVVAALARRGRRILRLQKVEPSLEEAFIALVGRRLEEADQPT